MTVAASSIPVLRNFFIDRQVDAAIARLALVKRVGKADQMAALLARGHQIVRDDMLAGKTPANAIASDLDEGKDQRQAMRSILIPANLDEEMRMAAHKNGVSKGSMLRWFIHEAFAAMP